MILNLPFKKLWYYQEKPVDIRLRLGSLEDLCDELGIKFWQIREYMESKDTDFSVSLLWHGYLTACEKSGTKPKHKKTDAAIWYEYMSVRERVKFTEELTILFGKVVDQYGGKKKVRTKQNGMNSSPLPSESLGGVGEGGEMQP